MKALSFSIFLNEPLLATQAHSGEANSRTSFSYIPGGMIRGAIIREYVRGFSGNDLAGNEKARALFFDGTVKFLNAYPTGSLLDRRMLPKPYSWFVEKNSLLKTRDILYDFAVHKKALENGKQLSKEFCDLIDEENGTVNLKSVSHQVSVHNASDNRNRKDKTSSQVFRYDAISAGETFMGIIISNEASFLSEIETLLKKKIFLLGGSHTGGYGHVQINNIELHNDWHEYEPENALKDSIIITFLSDAIIRSSEGHVCLNIMPIFGIKDNVNYKSFVVYQSIQLVGGFNRKWGLPLPQDWAIAAGSVFKFPADLIDKEKLSLLIEDGIGERRVEGFGRIACNWHTREERPWSINDSNLNNISAPSIRIPYFNASNLCKESKELAQLMANRILRIVLETELLKSVLEMRNKLDQIQLSTSQLSRLRIAARRAMQIHDLKPIEKFINGLNPNATKEWKQSKIGDNDFYNWILAQCNLDETNFSINFSIPKNLPEIAGVQSKINNKIQAEYRARFLDGVMKLAIEKRKEDKK